MRGGRTKWTIIVWLELHLTTELCRKVQGLDSLFVKYEDVLSLGVLGAPDAKC